MASEREAQKLRRNMAHEAEARKRLQEAYEWADEPTPYGETRSVHVIPGETLYDGIPIRRIDIDVAKSWLDAHPESWPGAATFPTHDHAQ